MHKDISKGAGQTEPKPLAEEQVKTAKEALQLARQRYKLGLGSVVEVTQSEVALTRPRGSWLNASDGLGTSLRRSITISSFSHPSN